MMLAQRESRPARMRRKSQSYFLLIRTCRGDHHIWKESEVRTRFDIYQLSEKGIEKPAIKTRVLRENRREVGESLGSHFDSCWVFTFPGRHTRRSMTSDERERRESEATEFELLPQRGCQRIGQFGLLLLRLLLRSVSQCLWRGPTEDGVGPLR